MKLFGVLLTFALLGLTSAGRSERKYEFKLDKSSVEITAEYKMEDKALKEKDESKLKWVLKATGGGFVSDGEGFQKSTDLQSQFRFENDLIEVVEYTPTDPTADDPYNNEVPVNTWKLDKWLDLVDVPGVSGDAHQVTWVTEDGFFKAIAKINTDGLSAAGPISLAPDDIKVDYEISYPVADGNRLAIIGKLKTKNKSKQRKDKEDDMTTDNAIDLADDTGLTSGYFSWVSDIQCGGATRKVKSKFIDNGGEDKEMSFTMFKLKADGNCVWDPVYGINFSAGNGIVASASMVALGAFFALFW